MLYAIFCYNSEADVGAMTREEDAALTAKLRIVEDRLVAGGTLGPSARLQPTTAAKTLRFGPRFQLVDGPFAETKEQLLGFYIVNCATFEDAVDAARVLALPRTSGALEIRPIESFSLGSSLP